MVKAPKTNRIIKTEAEKNEKVNRKVTAQTKEKQKKLTHSYNIV